MCASTCGPTSGPTRQTFSPSASSTVAAQGTFLPRSIDEMRILLDATLKEKVVYELEYELNNRPDWVSIPIQGLLQLLEDSGASA